MTLSPYFNDDGRLFVRWGDDSGDGLADGLVEVPYSGVLGYSYQELSIAAKEHQVIVLNGGR